MIFVDTGAWIALVDKSDQHYNDASIIYKKLKQQKERFLTTDYVVDETVTRLRYDANHQVAVKFLDLIEQSEKTRILRRIQIDETLFQNAIAIFRKYDSAVLSLTDCSSFAVCQMYNIYQAFAFDKHFTMMGISLCTP
jgi:predicted nucleic acid-binding protein